MKKIEWRLSDEQKEEFIKLHKELEILENRPTYLRRKEIKRVDDLKYALDRLARAAIVGEDMVQEYEQVDKEYWDSKGTSVAKFQAALKAYEAMKSKLPGYFFTNFTICKDTGATCLGYGIVDLRKDIGKQLLGQ